MAKNRKQRRSSLKAAKEVQEDQHNDVGMAEKVDDDDDSGDQITLAKIDAMSDSEEEDEAAEWDAEAQALRKAISEGAFEKLNLNLFKDGGGKEGNNDDKEETGGPVVLEDDSSSDEEDINDEDKVEGPKSNSAVVAHKALQSVTNGLVSVQKAMPWPETMDIVPSTPLPFGTVNEEGVLIQVHDDLKREVVFYNMALEAVHEARVKCDENNIPFSRPEDFFAEMVKTDDHMAKVKDRLIFETKKMDAFESRKSNREQKLRAKEKHAYRLTEKAKAKTRHMQDVQDWAKDAAQNRVGGGKVRDNDDDYLGRMGGVNKKRMSADRKFGHGGKKGRFKQNDPKSMNDMSQYNPKGGKGGMKSGGTKRKGKRSRDASKARR